MGLHDYTFYDLINRNAVSYRNLPAWFEVDDQRFLTFAAYKQKVDQLACGLQKGGFKKGDRIGVLGKNSLEYFLLYGAAAALGGIVLPINWRLSADEAVFNLNDGQPGILFVDSEFQGLIKDIKTKLTSVTKFFNLKPPGGEFSDFDGLLKNDGNFEPVEVSTGDGAVIIHTADVHLNNLPLFHVGGLFMATGAFHGGVLNVNMSKFDPTQAVTLIEEKKVSVMFDFSPILGSVLEAAEKSGQDISSLQHVIGLESPDVIEKFQETVGGTFYCMYGQTETSAIATYGRYSDKPGSAGRTIPLADVRLVDDDDHPVPTGEVGEIAVKGPMVFNEYINLPEDTAHAIRGGWHHTGDLGRFDEEGYLWYEGRKAEKELIKPGGENVYPAEVKEGIKAVCQLKSGETLDARELIKFVGSRIASFKKPQYIDFVSDLPRMDDDSPDRARVKELYGGPQS